jgi:hypothetical protein
MSSPPASAIADPSITLRVYATVIREPARRGRWTSSRKLMKAAG